MILYQIKGTKFSNFRITRKGVFYKKFGVGATALVIAEKRFGAKNVEAIRPSGKQVQVFIKVRKPMR